ncbi:MAG: ABC transporter ATP-binding protein [Acidobacteria bacterium]|nr:ABC transporter ATP-binding protein [Acidobacteriota bacterium]
MPSSRAVSPAFPGRGPAAALHGVTKAYGRVRALDQVSLALDQGAITALLGPNGAGKTTAVRVMLGLAPASAGRAELFGLPPTTPSARQRTGVMLQVAKVPETLTVREHVRLFSSYYPAPLPFDDVVDLVGLGGFVDRKYGLLSGGQQRRTLFALAVCGCPDMLFLDEPTVGLDVDARRGLWDVIRRLRERGTAILLTTHYLDEADTLADRVVVLRQGRMVADGRPDDIKRLVADRQIRCGTALGDDALVSLPGVRAVTREAGRATLLTDRAEQTLRALFALDDTVHHLEVTGAGLEDAFLALTGPATEID